MYARNAIARIHAKSKTAQPGVASRGSDSGSTSSYGPCGEYDYEDTSDYCNYDYVTVSQWESFGGGGGGGGGSYEVLERVTVDGMRTGDSCSVDLSGSWGSAFGNCGGLDALFLQQDAQKLASYAKQIAEGIQQLTDVFLPLLPKCAVATTNNPTKTPDQDKTNGWPLAADAVVVAYLGNFGALRIGERADVKYPNGSVVQVIIKATKAPDNVNPHGWVQVDRFGNGVPGNDTPCK